MHASLGGLRDVLYNRIRGGFEESACCLQETVLVMAVRGGGGGEGGRDERPSRTINREELKLEGSERRGGGEEWGVGGGTCQKRTKGIQDKGTFTRTKCTSTSCYLQVQQSFKFPVG